MQIEYRSNELYHHGVPGMKWGVRKNKNVKTNKRVSRKELKKQRKAIAKDYFDTRRIKESIYNRDFNRGKITGTEDSWERKAYNEMKKKYGKTKLDDAIKWNEKAGEKLSIVSSMVGVAGVIGATYLLNKK